MARGGDKAEEALLRRIQRGSNVDKARAVAIAKSQGLLRQSGENLVLTEKGRNAAANAQANGE